jgi:hypothetical protein
MKKISKKVEYVKNIPNGYNVNKVINVTNEVSKMFGCKVKKAYAILSSFYDEPDMREQNVVTINESSLICDSIYIIFDENHKVMFEGSEDIFIKLMS